MKKIVVAISVLLVLLGNGRIGYAQFDQVTTYSKSLEMDARPSKEELALEQEKYKEAVRYMEAKAKDIKATSSSSSKINLVGGYRQATDYTCGPASARNLIKGFVDANNYSYVPTESVLATELKTTTSGTSFETSIWQNPLYTYAPGNLYYVAWGSGSVSEWKEAVKTRINTTLDKRVYWYPASRYLENFNVIANLYYTNGTSYPIRPEYNRSVVRHHITVYGYNNNTETYYIADSNSSVPVYYTTSYVNLSESVRGRGIIW
jgi:hypothetical protein